MGKIRSNIVILDSLVDNMVDISGSHHHIHEGEAFVSFIKPTILAGGTYAITIITGSYPIHHNRLQISPSADKLQIDIYENSVVNIVGTPLTKTNRNRMSNNLANTIIRVGDTFTNDGTKLDGFSIFLPGATGTGQSLSGSMGDFGEEIVLKSNTVYKYLFTNNSASSNTVGITLNWYEF